MAGRVAYPPKMFESISQKVKLQTASWNLHLLNIEMAKLEKKLEVFTPKADTQIPPPRVSPAVMKLARQQAENLLAIMQGNEAPHKLAKRASHEEVLKAFYRVLSGARGYGIWGVHGEEVKAPSDLSDLKGQLSSLSKAKGIEGKEERADQVLAAVLWTVARTAYSNAAEKAAFAIDEWRSQKAKLADRKAGDTSTVLDRSDSQEAQSIRATMAEVAEFQTYLRELGVEASNPTRKGLRVKVGGERATWEEPVDLTGLPSSYPVDAVQTTFKTIKVETVVAKSPAAGSWDTATHTLTVISKVAGNKESFLGGIERMNSTLKHELEHMVQYLMRESLKMQGKNSDRAGTPYGPRDPAPGVEQAQLAEDSDAPRLKRHKSLKEHYPEATDQELYYLDPIEFFPQIGSWVFRFAGLQPVGKRDPVGWLKSWKDFAGLTSDSKYTTSPFYSALKKYNRPLYRRAVAEGWKEALKVLNERTEDSPRLDRHLRASNIRHMGTNLAGTFDLNDQQAEVSDLRKQAEAILAALDNAETCETEEDFRANMKDARAAAKDIVSSISTGGEL